MVWDGEEAGQLPFVPLEVWGRWIDEESGRTYSAYWYRCSNLLPNGRCGDYDNRPGLCRSFEPASDPLCVHWRGAESGEESVL
jgi:Fe-S-cluster containining protein